MLLCPLNQLRLYVDTVIVTHVAKVVLHTNGQPTGSTTPIEQAAALG
jgi:hypothetical protein